MCAARLAEKMGRVDAKFVERQQKLLAALRLPLEVPAFDHDELLDFMRRDKKVDDGKLRFVLPDRIGHVELVKDVRTDDVLAALDA
jgi:3-dehydroquinate synthase